MWFIPVIATAALLLGTLGQQPQPLPPDFRRGCASGELPDYRAGFAALYSEIRGAMGTAWSCEFSDPRGTGDVLQRTGKGGLAFWRRSTNTPTFTDGAQHWALTDRGLVTWSTPSIDPPPDALLGAGQGDPRTYRDACDRGIIPPDAPVCQPAP